MVFVSCRILLVLISLYHYIISISFKHLLMVPVLVPRGKLLLAAAKVFQGSSFRTTTAGRHLTLARNNRYISLLLSRLFFLTFVVDHRWL